MRQRRGARRAWSSGAKAERKPSVMDLKMRRMASGDRSGMLMRWKCRNSLAVTADRPPLGGALAAMNCVCCTFLKRPIFLRS